MLEMKSRVQGSEQKPRGPLQLLQIGPESDEVTVAFRGLTDRLCALHPGRIDVTSSGWPPPVSQALKAGADGSGVRIRVCIVIFSYADER